MKKPRLKRVKGDSYYGSTASQYEVKRKKQPWWTVEQNEMQKLLDLLPRDLSVVDIPFGTGRFVPYYLERGYKVHGLDSSSAMLDTAAEILGDQYEECETKTGFSTDLPFEDEQFDLLVSTRFLRDIIVFSDVKTTLAEFARVTKRYAIIQLGFRNEEPFVMPAEDERMTSRMSETQVFDLLREYGFEPIQHPVVKIFDEGAADIRHVLLKKK